jgi:hypothetical protein
MCFAIDHVARSGSHDRETCRVRFLADVCPELTPPWPGSCWISPTPIPARAAQEAGIRSHRRPSRRDDQSLDVPPVGGRQQLSARDLSGRYHPGQLAAERLFSWQLGRRHGQQRQHHIARGDTVEPLADVLAADRGAARRRRSGLSGAAAARRSAGHGRRGSPNSPMSANRAGSRPCYRAGRACRPGAAGDAHRQERRAELRAAEFHDSVGVGSYNIDLHPSTGGDNYIDFETRCPSKSRSALCCRAHDQFDRRLQEHRHDASDGGCYRLHPVEWGIGEAAGCLVFANRPRISPIFKSC